MRCGIYALAALVERNMKQDPLNGDVFVFISKSGNQLRLLQWDEDGYALYSKRLERGTFERPQTDGPRLTLQQLQLIVQGIRLQSALYRKRYRHVQKI